MTKCTVIDSLGQRQELDVTMEATKAAAAEGYSSLFAKWDSEIVTAEGGPTASQQVCAQNHLYLAGGKMNIPNAIMADILDGKNVAGSNVQDAVPASRILYPPFLMTAIDSALRSSDYGAIATFNSKAAITESIANTKFERPILNFSRPEGARSKPIAQLAEPTSMLVITSSDKSWKITGTSIGLEISDEAVKATSLDLVSLSMIRQAETEAVARAEEQLLAFLNGDSDLDMVALSSVSGAVSRANQFDTSISTAGVLSQKAWVKFLFNNSRKRRIDTVITDIDGALAIENRTGRPTVNTDNNTSKRIDTRENVMNPMWPDQVDLIITMDPNWPANTIVGFDSRYGYQIVNSTTLSYQAVEAYVMRRSTKFRVDSGSISYRLFDDAWNVLSLATS